MNLKWVPVVDTTLCTGCQMCVEACAPGCLEIKDLVAVLTNPGVCGSEEHCIAPCPIDVIRMEWVQTDADQSIGQWKTEKPL